MTARDSLRRLPPVHFQGGIMRSWFGGAAQLNPQYFATPEAAQALAAQIPGSRLLKTNNFKPPYVGPDSIAIRLPNGSVHNVGLIIAGLHQGIPLSVYTGNPRR